jgi:hypothetical protein
VEGTTPHDRYPREIAAELVHHVESAFTGESHTFEQEYDGEYYPVRMIHVRSDDDAADTDRLSARNGVTDTESVVSITISLIRS